MYAGATTATWIVHVCRHMTVYFLLFVTWRRVKVSFKQPNRWRMSPSGFSFGRHSPSTLPLNCLKTDELSATFL